MAKTARRLDVSQRTIRWWFSELGISKKTGKMEVECSWCGGLVKKWPKEVRKTNHHFCSDKCYSQWVSEAQSGESNPNWKGGVSTHICSYCGKKFTKKRWNQYNEWFCSRDCQAKWQSENRTGENSPTWNGGKVKLTCLNCRQEFKVHPKRKDTAKFCSHKCLGEWRSKNWKGEDNPSWRGGHPRYYGENWEKQKRKALNRDSHTCQMCGAPENGQRHDVHHIKPIREFEDPASANSLDNLVTLCRSCHIKAETMREGEPRWKTKENS